MMVNRDKIGDCSSTMTVISLSTFPNENAIAKEKETIIGRLSDHVGLNLVWQNLIVSTKESKKKEFLNKIRFCKTKFQTKEQILLNNISGTISGGLCAVMGPSGSGKSTLLNTLACRLDVNTNVSGEIRLNGCNYTNRELKVISGYVMQDDLLNGYLTVYETLIFTGELRLNRKLRKEEREERVNEVMNQMGISHVKDVIVGTVLKQGISGGERKRLCVGMELLNRPQLLFLDEPTSGLDSVTALDLMEILHSLAHGQEFNRSVTVVCSIHQPQSKIFNLFDSIILLKGGNIIYQGLKDQILEVFSEGGYPCPMYTNPADHIIDVITPSKTTTKNQSLIDKSILSVQQSLQINLNLGSEKSLDQMKDLRENAPWLKQVSVLFQRNVREQIRLFEVFLTSIIQTIIIAFLFGIVFIQIGNDQSSIIRRNPALFFCVINQGIFGSIMVINSFPIERELALRERTAGTYCSSAYFIGKTFSEILFQIPIPIVFSCIVYFLIGFQFHVGKFVIFTLFMILCSLSATSLALMISALCRTTNMSVTVLPMVFEVIRLFGGFFLSPSRLPKYFSWLDALSYIKYVYVAIGLNELRDLKLTCTQTEIDSKNCITNGETTIKNLGFDYITIWGCFVVLISFIIAYRIIAYLGIRFLKH